ncbi:MAG TPA: endo-1,4-beta-xylanase [Chitinophagaceae bacterium]|nr:endo-1,4-beta-xylanase [Chitinophagaceae bacterium]
MLENRLRLRGHNLVWPARKFTPAVFSKQADFGPSFSDSITRHIQDIVTYARGKVYGWDVKRAQHVSSDIILAKDRTVKADYS